MVAEELRALAASIDAGTVDATSAAVVLIHEGQARMLHTANLNRNDLTLVMLRLGLTQLMS